MSWSFLMSYICDHVQCQFSCGIIQWHLCALITQENPINDMKYAAEQLTFLSHTVVFCRHMPEDCHSNNLLKQQGEGDDGIGLVHSFLCSVTLCWGQLSDVNSYCHTWTWPFLIQFSHPPPPVALFHQRRHVVSDYTHKIKVFVNNTCDGIAWDTDCICNHYGHVSVVRACVTVCVRVFVSSEADVRHID